MRWMPLLVLAVLLPSLGCDENPLGPTAIRDVTWKLEAIEQAGSPPIAIASPERYTLRLEADGRANARADCNSCNGRYTLDGSKITIGPSLACTQAFCGTAIDTVYASALGQVTTISVSDTVMVLRGPNVTLRFRN